MEDSEIGIASTSTATDGDNQRIVQKAKTFIAFHEMNDRTGLSLQTVLCVFAGGANWSSNGTFNNRNSSPSLNQQNNQG
jgi:hypothetical protein